MTEIQQVFFDRINQLGPGERAGLRRQAGAMIRDADGKTITAFYRCLPSSIDIKQENKWFAIACMRCLWDPGEEKGETIETVIAGLIKSGGLSKSVVHRVQLLLDSKWDGDGYMLTKLVRLVKLVRQKSDRVQIDFSALLEDLLRWNNDSQMIQRKWARVIFTSGTKKGKE